MLSYIPMEEQVFNGHVSDLENIFSSTVKNNYYYQLAPSRGMYRLSADQIYCIKYKAESSTTIDTLYAPRTDMYDETFVGDLRLRSNYRMSAVGGQDAYSERSSFYQRIYKVVGSRIMTYRSPMVYLRYAEALNRAGYPQSAFAVLKYGLCNDNLGKIDKEEQGAAGDLIVFSPAVFTFENTRGIHSRGSGDSECNAYYVMPMPATALGSRQDTIDYQIPLVEELIVDEMALEGAFEGNRFFDLVRVASRPDRDASYLANRIAMRGGTIDTSLRALLMDKNNWFLPLPQ
jgi:hypothetical protein